MLSSLAADPHPWVLHQSTPNFMLCSKAANPASTLTGPWRRTRFEAFEDPSTASLPLGKRQTSLCARAGRTRVPARVTHSRRLCPAHLVCVQSGREICRGTNIRLELALYHPVLWMASTLISC